MPFQPGHRKTGGRQKGVKNKYQEALSDKCERLGIDLFEALLELTLHEDMSIRMTAIKEACQYVYPKKRAMEISGDVNLELAKKAEEYSALTKEQQIELMRVEIKKLEGNVE